MMRERSMQFHNRRFGRLATLLLLAMPMALLSVPAALAANRFSLPLFERWQEKYGSREDVLIVSIHTVFEGHSSQAPHKLKRFVDRERFGHPVGIDAYSEEDDETPITMKRFRTRGTPHVVIIDKEGRLRLSRFGRFETAAVEQMIDHLLQESVLEDDAVIGTAGRF